MKKKGKYQVIVYNDEHHTFQKVTSLLTTACNLSYFQALQCVEIIDSVGKYEVFESSHEACINAYEIIRKSGMQCEVRKKPRQKRK